MKDISKQPENLQDRIPSDMADSIFNVLQHEKSRKHIIEIIKEREDNVEFVEKVRKYSGQEIDSRLFVSARFYITAILTAIISVVVAEVIRQFFSK
jgi:hypothetical protein